MDQNQNQNQNQEQEQNQAWDYTQTTYEAPVQDAKPAQNGYAVASLVLGVVSIVLCCCSCVSIVTSILAIVFAFLSRQGQPMSSKAIGGLVCGIISIVLIVVSIVFSLYMYAETNVEDLKDFYSELYPGLYDSVEGETSQYDYYYDYTPEQ